MKKATFATMFTVALTLLLTGMVSAGTVITGNTDKHNGVSGSGSEYVQINPNPDAEPAAEMAPVRRSYCFFWGLIGRCGFQVETSFEAMTVSDSDIQSEQPETELKDSQNYRSILWGAVQWSKRDAGATPDELNNEAHK